MLVEKVIREFIDKSAVQKFLTIIQNYNYCIIGGMAVSFYTNSARKVSPDDLDIYLDAKQINSLKEELIGSGFEFVKQHNFNGTTWSVFKYGKQEFDVALKDLSFTAFRSSSEFDYGGLKLKVINKYLLINNKLLAARDKDIRDLLYLFKTCSISELKEMRKKLSRGKIELFDQLMEDLGNFELMRKVYGDA